LNTLLKRVGGVCGAAAIWLELYCKAWPLTRQPPACSPAKAWWWRWQTPPCPTHLTLPRPASCQTMSSRQSLLSLNFQTSKTAPLSARIGTVSLMTRTTMCGECIASENWQKRHSSQSCSHPHPHIRLNCGHFTTRGIQPIAQGTSM